MTWQSVLWEVVKYAIPLFAAWVWGRLGKTWSKWASLDSTLSSLRELVEQSKASSEAGTQKLSEQMTVHLNEIEARLNTKMTGIEQGLNTKIGGVDARLQQVGQGLTRLRSHTGLMVQRLEMRLVRQQERLNNVLHLVDPERAKVLTAEWNRQDNDENRIAQEEQTMEELIAMATPPAGDDGTLIPLEQKLRRH